ncbi:MAG: hypothetical protein K2H34_02145, partial [Lachnospiraceae bacterium]|nr:hypothetical protein [Lachnospiraceae bacterium]
YYFWYYDNLETKKTISQELITLTEDEQSTNEKDDSQRSDWLTPKKQIDIFADEAGEWSRNFDRSSSFTVADLNQDGRLELITDVIQGSGHFAYNHYFTVDKAGDLTELQSDRFGEYLSTYYDSEDGLIHVPVYYDEKRDVYYSIQGGGNVDRPSISFVYYLDSVSIENGGVKQETLAYQICEREDEYADLSYHYQDIDGEEITEEKFRTIAERKYVGLKNMQMTWKWQNISKEELDAMSKEELEELLMDSYQNFKIVDEAG